MKGVNWLKKKNGDQKPKEPLSRSSTAAMNFAHVLNKVNENKYAFLIERFPLHSQLPARSTLN